MRAEFEHWHSHEHFPERLRIPGFARASRWMDAAGGDGVFVCYELEAYEVLASGPYLERLNAPSPWSTRMMPHHRNMVRTQCRVLETSGAAVARHAATLRLSPASDSQAAALRAGLAALARALTGTAGFCGGHLLQHQAPALAMTTEQRIRGGDAEADWIFVVMGYDAQALAALLEEELGEAALQALGAAPGAARGLFTLSHSATPADVL